jgi:7-cyano-7-deazaguanine synthase
MYSDNAPAPTDSMLVVLSGGLDSSTALALATLNTKTVITLAFNYGQKHSRELESAKALSKHYDASAHLVFDTPALALIKQPKDYNPGEFGGRELLPRTWKPGRNMIFLSYAMSLAYSLSVPVVVTGIHLEDTPGYPDCREQFLTLIEEAGREALANHVSLWTPLLNYAKCDIVGLGLKLKVPYEKTWTCYLGEATPCHRCDACVRRERAFHYHGIEDPLNESSVLP